MDLGVTIVDDSDDRTAESIVKSYQEKFALGITYQHSGARNISIARNLALEDAKSRGDWIAMTDDDCEPSENWIPELVRVQEWTKADVTTGLMLRRAPAHAPDWIKSQPFLELGEFGAVDGETLSTAFTNNCLISSKLLCARPDLRFDPNLGKIGGEDMVFFQSLSRLDYRLNFAKNAWVWENEPEERLTLRYQIRRYFWHGNSSVITSIRGGLSRKRLTVHTAATLVRAFIRPFKRLAKRQPPEIRFFLAQISEGFGKFVGLIGIKVEHK